MNPFVSKAITNMAGDPVQVFKARELPNLGERIATRFKDVGKDFVQTGKSLAQIADRLDGRKPLFLIINTMPYMLSNCHVEESYETGSNYQESNHPDSPPILIPDAHTLTLTITLPLGREQDHSKFMIIKNAIRLQTLLVGTSKVLKAEGGFIADEKINVYDSFRFGVFTGATPSPISGRAPKSFDDKRLDKAVKSCAKEKKIDWKVITASQQKEITSCVKDKEADYVKEQKEIADYKKARADASCAEEELYEYSTKGKTDEEIAELKLQSDILRRSNNFRRNALRRSTRTEFRKQPKHVRKGIRKHEGFPWQIQISCAYFGRNEFMLFGTLIKFTAKNGTDATREVWEITLLGFNFRHDPRLKRYTPKKSTEDVIHDAKPKEDSRACASVHKDPIGGIEVDEKIKNNLTPEESEPDPIPTPTPEQPEVDPKIAENNRKRLAEEKLKQRQKEERKKIEAASGGSTPGVEYLSEAEFDDVQKAITDGCEKEKNLRTVMRVAYVWQNDKYVKKTTVCEDSDVARITRIIIEGTVSGGKAVFNFFKKPFTVDTSPGTGFVSGI